MTQLTDLGEDALITRLVRKLQYPNRLLVGPGDDCAVVDLPDCDKVQLLKADTVVEDVHFTLEVNPKRIGWKAMARAVSDIAAMGGLPDCALVSLCLPSKISVEWLEEMYEGMARFASRFGIAIVGGETSRTAGPLVISISMTGYVEANRCVLRSTGEPGDILIVTGVLGGSLEGHHLDFVPRLRHARWLVENFRIGAMMDLSDGLAKDLPRLAAASGCGYYLNDQLLPVRPGCTVTQAMSDGEDYELLLAVPAAEAQSLMQQWPREFPHIPITAIGSLVYADLELEGVKTLVGGFDHFPPDMPALPVTAI